MTHKELTACDGHTIQITDNGKKTLGTLSITKDGRIGVSPGPSHGWNTELYFPTDEEIAGMRVVGDRLIFSTISVSNEV